MSVKNVQIHDNKKCYALKTKDDVKALIKNNKQTSAFNI